MQLVVDTGSRLISVLHFMLNSWLFGSFGEKKMVSFLCVGF